MSILEYALDVNKDVSIIVDLCKKLGIKKSKETDILSEDDIIMLDNELDSMKENLNPDYELDEELEEKVENLVNAIDIDLDEVNTKKEKVKSKVELKSDAKAKYLKGKKEIYKHRDKLMNNQEENDVIIYKDNMTVSLLAQELKVSPTEIVKKLFNLGIMANINQSISYDTCELILSTSLLSKFLILSKL